MYPGFRSPLSNGGSNNCTSPRSRRTSRSSNAFIAFRERSASPAPDNTPQPCPTESIWHSVSPADPSGPPSSKYARRYQPPSHALRSIAALTDRKSKRLNSNHLVISYAVFSLKKKRTESCSHHPRAASPYYAEATRPLQG